MNEVRVRNYEGLKIGEDVVWEAAKKTFNTSNKSRFQKEVGQLISKFRERYRNATRHKFLDSIPDLDLILLAYELNATIVSSDEGVVLWGRNLGIKELPPDFLKERLFLLLDHLLE